MPTTVRRATEADSDSIAAVFQASRGTIAYLPKLHSAEDTRNFMHHVVRDLETFAAVRQNEVVGFAALRGDWLDHLYVHPSRFNTLTGTKLFAEVRFQRPSGFQFWVFQQNASARRFYERLGCALVRLTNGQANEEKLPDALYVWPSTRRPE